MKFTNIMCMPTSMSILATTATHIRNSHQPKTYGTVLRLPTPQEFGRQFNPILRRGRIHRWVPFHGWYI